MSFSTIHSANKRIVRLLTCFLPARECKFPSEPQETTHGSTHSHPEPAVRTKRVREARDEAKKEIEDYRKSKEEEFKKFEAQHSEGNKEAEDEANKEAELKIKEIKAAGQKSQDKVVKDLLKAVFDVKPVAPTAA